MEALRLDTLAAQVVAWHNRHPLARRIAAAQVHSMGYVLLPAMQVQPQGVATAAAPATVLPTTHTAAVDEAGHDEVARGDPAAPLTEADTAAVTVAAGVDPSAALAQRQPELVTATQPANADAETVADATAEVPSAPPASLAQPQEAVATALADVLAADPPIGAAPVVEPAAAPSLRERLASRPAQALPEAAMPAKPAVAPQSAPPGLPAAAPLPNTATAPLRLAFTERFFEHDSARRVAAWALQQARVLVVRLPMGVAVRRLQREPSLSVAAPGVDENPVDLLLRTATLEVGGRRLRLLIGPGDDPAVLGPRLWSLPRVALACLPVLLLPLTAGTAWWLGAQSVRASPALAAAQHPAAAAASAVAGSGPAAPGYAAAAEPAVAVADANANVEANGNGNGNGNANPALPPQAADVAFAAYAASAASAASAAATAVINEPPEDAEPRLGRVELPPLGPLFSDPRFEPTMQRRLAARAASSQMAAPPPAAAAGPAVPADAPAAAVAAMALKAAASTTAVRPPAGPAAAADPAAAPAPAPPPAAAFALTTRLLRTAAESEQMQAAMRALLALMVEGSARVQRVPVGDDWRVIGGPFVSRAAADKARAQLLARGVKTEVVEIPPAATEATVATVATPGR